MISALKETKAAVVLKVIILAMTLGSPGGMLYAQSQKSAPLTELHEFSIPADDLAKTLVEIAVQGKIPVVVPYELIKGFRSSPVIGTMPITDALTKLLRRTPFTFRIDETSAQITIVRRQATVEEHEVLTPEKIEDENLDEILITGIRASLTQSMDLKRYALGVVDAISAEDIGKFPDTNLAESIQRIPGATISRNNGEGSRVTVRGFTDNHNLVTFNGRVVPVIATSVERIDDSRAFEFSNLASDNVRQVLIHKTHQADLPEGGIGALIDIQSYRPLNNRGRKNYLSVKALHDQSNDSGRSVTPEIATLLTLSDSVRWGVSVAATLQERDSGSARAYISQWSTYPWSAGISPTGTHGQDCASSGGNPLVDNCSTIDNAPYEGQLYSLPNDLHYALYESTRKRVNSHWTAQFKPTESWTMTLDYAQFETWINHNVAETLLRLTNNRSYLAFDHNSVKAPQSTIETIYDSQGQATASVLGFAAQEHEQHNRTQMLGFNMEYGIGDDWQFALDGHKSKSRSGPDGAPWGSWQNVRFGANVVGRQKINWRDLPSVAITIDDQLLAPHNADDGVFNASDIGTQVAFTNYSQQRIEVDELRLTGQWFGSYNDLKFGANFSCIANHTQFSDYYYTMGDWGIQDPSGIPDEYFTTRDFAAEFSDFDTSEFALQSFTADADALISWAQQAYPEEFAYGYHYSDDFSDDRLIEERSQALFVQYHHSLELSTWQIDLVGGLRYVTTDVDSSTKINIPSEIIWLDNGDFDTVYVDNKKLEKQSYQYDNWLPNFNINLTPNEQWVVRLAYSESLSRAEYSEMSPEVTNIRVTGITIDGQNNAFAEVGNPRLEPIKSANFDLSLEWYFAESSYLSVGYYAKEIDNFIGIESVDRTVYALRDSSSGARAEQARSDIESQPDYDGVTTDTDLFNQIAATENNDFSGLGSDTNYYGDNYDIHPLEDDPYFQFSTQIPNNNKQIRIWGIEYAAQAFLGDSGFGLQANYTSVDGDVGYQVNAAPNSRQFALLGLSDSMNLVALYEKYGIQARIAYNWRDSYLDSLAIEPTFIENYHQIDFMLSYQLTEAIDLSFEGINITGENSRSYGRSKAQLNTLVQLEPRYLLGLKYQF